MVIVDGLRLLHICLISSLRDFVLAIVDGLLYKLISPHRVCIVFVTAILMTAFQAFPDDQSNDHFTFHQWHINKEA